ncbi:MAG: HAD-IIB family hydrolase [Oligoflexia bacterium]|nr:HAD-IIB family hydrolase [Oligoflexia bacterium]
MKTSNSPLALNQLSKDFCKNLKVIFSDIDDTISLEGKIPLEAYESLWSLKKAGIRMIPITGRPAGWVDHIARMWPVDAVIGENGAFYFYLNHKLGRDGKLEQVFIQTKNEREKNFEKLYAIFQNLRKKYPDLQLASDQNYRKIDIAIDFCEDVSPALPNETIHEIVHAFTAEGAQAKISSIHVNAWFGSHDKFTCCKKLLTELYQEDFDKNKNNYLYFGDSPNDEPLFREFPQTIGVKNVENFLPLMKYHPTFITTKLGGLGFAEAVDYILKNRS